MSRLDEQQVYQWFDLMKGNNELVEIRLIGSNKTASGYFSDAQTLINAIKPYTDTHNVYFTINKVNDACYGREQKDKIVQRPKNTTTDSEIVVRDYVLVDLDAKRLTGVCATKEEATRAHEKGKIVYKFLVDNGFYEPIVVFSSSGIHLYIRCALLNTDENTKLIRRFLEALSMLFSDEHVDVDTKVFNAARISRLPGSYSCKGANNDPDRPQRKCRFLHIPDEVKINEREYFEKIASLYPEDEKPTRENNYSVTKFNLDEFLEKHKINVVRIDSVSGGKKYILDHCPFNEQHRGKDAVIFQRDSGEIAFHCFHSSCANNGWRELRLMYEPDAYTKKEYNEFKANQRRYGATTEVKVFKPQEESEDKGKKWLGMSDIKRVNIEELLSIPTGYDSLDKKIVGLFAGELSILSGLNASGKTSWLDCLALNVINRGFKVGVWSGEMQDWRFQSWITQIAAGKNYTRKKEGYDNLYYVPQMFAEKVSEWLDDKLFLYNNSYGSDWQQLFHDIKELVEQRGVQLVLIDNLAALSIDGYDGEKWSRQTKFILDVKDYAKQKNIHIVLVCHPRKENFFLRKESISGTADLTNIADNVFLLHRVGKDFETRAGEFFGKDKASEYMQYGNVLEVAKNRQFGVVDHLVGLYYEQESRRLKNSIAEHIIYGWQEEPVQQPMFVKTEEEQQSIDDAPSAGYTDYVPF
jgi:archaellum biogenesis ATPase FlaH